MDAAGDEDSSCCPIGNSVCGAGQEGAGTDSVGDEGTLSCSAGDQATQLPVHKCVSATAGVRARDDMSNLRPTSSGPDQDMTGGRAVEEDVMIAQALKSFVSAVHQKYGDDSLEEVVENVFVRKSGPVKVTSSGSIVLPKQVTMSGCEIDVAGDPRLISRMCQKVHELDLMENNITRWQEVFSIIQCIPNLRFLNLTKNHMWAGLPDLAGLTPPPLTHLVLNNTSICWADLISLLHLFPSLEELHLSLNKFDAVDTSSGLSLSPPLVSYPSLQKLFFISNNVLQWSEIIKLGSFFPGLNFLLLSETDIESLGDEAAIPGCFPRLAVLGLNRTGLSSWEEIEKLRRFPALTDVRMSGVPFLENLNGKFRRSHTVAILPNIATLNGSPVMDSEREDAERAYIRLYMDSEEKPARYFELEQKYGRLEPLVKVKLAPTKSVKLLVKVEDLDGSVKSSEMMDIDMGQTVKELKKLLSNIAGRPPAKYQLFYHDNGCCQGPVRLQYSERKLHSYSMHEGDELVIWSKDS